MAHPTNALANRVPKSIAKATSGLRAFFLMFVLGFMAGGFAGPVYAVTLGVAGLFVVYGLPEVARVMREKGEAAHVEGQKP